MVSFYRLCGSYGAMDGGNLCDALVDFTSGLAEMILLKEGYRDEPKKVELRKIMLREYEDHALMCCAISVSVDILFANLLSYSTYMLIALCLLLTGVRFVSI